ncbi:MAG: pyridoxal 5'-phosphate synthase glutaminase subunit PdxT [Candidatus Magasanikbacteria bacterium]|jgi:pyridoxal 5'-phosphate synthase pdxT subunit|nr:pyridoxal 5'-phosphate synthase glutaminase subunit PdxT [Candidatus Magasanikbacteria bacterium]MBT4314680.1 pyridoxal 5'-phosphate synthase glutaminase subunit PdxT [Candidatus Magasanikbacteria bacterium]MBT4547259.1 pyridoxal 5'-phosphate synthase glutaminase subunit PdxT [Candidatus Magasanikbacteria bacterium]MBT6818805.1 pyridoxal 5'-phosphate synthase glutaminase subunit PdxT [Candidatus Magasanikbacteria bacterium]
MKKIGVLDIQGSVEEHFAILDSISKDRFEPVLVKTIEDINGLSGLVLPGGESTAIDSLLQKYNLDNEIVSQAKNGMFVWGTCAGAIILSELGLIDIGIERNAYGGQLHSFETELEFNGKKIPGVFIRAPKINRVGEGVEILSKHDGGAVAVRKNNILVTTFHPELTDNITVHEYFVEMCL